MGSYSRAPCYRRPSPSRYIEIMRYNRLGHTGLFVSELSFGNLGAVNVRLDESDFRALLEHAQ